MQGAAYVFVDDGTSWSQQAYLKASNTDEYNYFGINVAVSGDRLVVTAHTENSAAVGVNGNQDNTGTSNSGAGYVFLREGGTWTQQLYLKALNTGAGDWFGVSAAVSGDTIVIGANKEDSAATGVGGNMLDDSADRAGAVYSYSPFIWGNLGGGTPGIDGQPQLVVAGPLSSGSELELDLTNAPANAPVLLWASFTSVPVAVLGGTLYANPYNLQLLLAVNASGIVSFEAPIGPALPSGLDLYLQCIVQDLSAPGQLTLSNARMATTP